MFGGQTFAEDWALSDALAIWYALGYFCYLFSVASSNVFEPKSLTALLDSGYSQLIYKWKMPESVSQKFNTFVRDNLKSITTAWDQISDASAFNLFFVHFTDRILGGNAAFSSDSLVET